MRSQSARGGNRGTYRLAVPPDQAGAGPSQDTGSGPKWRLFSRAVCHDAGQVGAETAQDHEYYQRVAARQLPGQAQEQGGSHPMPQPLVVQP